ncbi:methyltransferase family protein, partial [Actinomyces sp. oral taxon 171]|uniref:methyltransferase family protein n=1 Tax=Actinomyces sp. oral taxon 171 TaxID=706438 RepID=UPI0001F61CB9
AAAASSSINSPSLVQPNAFQADVGMPSARRRSFDLICRSALRRASNRARAESIVARNSPSALIPLAGFVWLIDRHQIPAEEKALEERFGQDYLDYKEAVPRWLGTPWCTQGCCRSLCRR